jgi:hypothetical protein
MRLSADQEARLAQHVRPLLADMPAPQTKLLGYDHNWGSANNNTTGAEYVNALLKGTTHPNASALFAGVAWHCYSGDVTTQGMEAALLAKHRGAGLETHITECSGGSWSGSWASSLAWNQQNLFIGGSVRCSSFPSTPPPQQQRILLMSTGGSLQFSVLDRNINSWSAIEFLTFDLLEALPCVRSNGMPRHAIFVTGWHGEFATLKEHSSGPWPYWP